MEMGVKLGRVVACICYWGQNTVNVTLIISGDLRSPE